MANSIKVIDEYLNKSDWRVNENSNAPYSYGALGRRVMAACYEEYWLNQIYTPEMREAHVSGSIHKHDLGGLTLYCCGYSIEKILQKGVRGIPNISKSKPASHFDAALNQIANMATVYQNEIMGAVAFSSLDTYLAPLVARDKLDYKRVKQALQNFIFCLNSNSRGGAEPAFTNISFDLVAPKDMENKPVLIGGKYDFDHTYGDFQEEMDLINRAFCELMLDGDSQGEPFAYPIPTYNIHEKFDWDNPNNDLLWEMTGKYGVPYFGNFVNSDMDISDVRSMCCHLRLDLRELRKSTGGLFGSDDNTGSIGVVTLNLPRYGLLAHGDVDELKTLIKYYMNLSKDMLETTRAFLDEEILQRHAIPAFEEYVGTFNNHFSTIGLVGMNEMCLNMFGKDIEDPDMIELCQDILHMMNDELIKFQEETGHLYNLEATPAESTCYRLASIDKRLFPHCHVQGEGEEIYYTNSCCLPVNKQENIAQILDHQEQLQPIFTGGTAQHLYLGHSISGAKAKEIIKYAMLNTAVPYVTISPLTKFCPTHKFVLTNGDVCPECGRTLNQYQRVTGYTRNVAFFNLGKKGEFRDRIQLGGN